jgi:hypothetical protein
MIIADAPPQAVAAIEAALPRLTRAVEGTDGRALRAGVVLRGPDIARGLGRLSTRAGIATPIAAPVHVVGLDRLAAGGDLPRGEPQLWSQILDADDAPGVALADVDARTWRFAAVAEGQGVRALASSITALRAEGGGPDRDLALLRIPALHLTAVWLKGRAGPSDDVIIPNAGPIAPLEPGKRYTLTEFLAITRAMAADRLAMSRGDNGG